MSVPADGHRYYTGQYWNDFETVRRHLDHRTTGDSAAVGERFPAFTRAYDRCVEWFQSAVRSRRTSPPR